MSIRVTRTWYLLACTIIFISQILLRETGKVFIVQRPGRQTGLETPLAELKQARLIIALWAQGDTNPVRKAEASPEEELKQCRAFPHVDVAKPVESQKSRGDKNVALLPPPETKLMFWIFRLSHHIQKWVYSTWLPFHEGEWCSLSLSSFARLHFGISPFRGFCLQSDSISSAFSRCSLIVLVHWRHPSCLPLTRWSYSYLHVFIFPLHSIIFCKEGEVMHISTHHLEIKAVLCILKCPGSCRIKIVCGLLDINNVCDYIT